MVGVDSSWQPAHRLAIYRRNLAWFDFWLNKATAATDRPGKNDHNLLKVMEDIGHARDEAATLYQRTATSDQCV